MGLGSRPALAEDAVSLLAHGVGLGRRRLAQLVCLALGRCAQGVRLVVGGTAQLVGFLGGLAGA